MNNLKLGVAILLALVSSGAYAEWVKVSDDPIATGYIDPTSIRKAGNKSTLWILVDFKIVGTANGVGYISVKSKYESNCATEEVRELYTLYHADNMGTGTVVYTDTDKKQWEPFAPASVAKVIWQKSCGKK